MISGYSPADGDRRVLMGGDIGIEENLKFGFEELYERTSPTGEKFRPKPSLQSISVDEKLESFECTVQWTANSISQLNRLFPFFMNIGTSVIVDWGWDDVPPGGIIDPSNVAQVADQYRTLNSNFQGGSRPAATQGAETQGVQPANPNIDSRTINRYAHPKYKQLQAGEGRYSFVAGVISDFSFSPDGNNQYSCTTDITSISKAMRKLRTIGQENVRNQQEEADDQTPLKKSLTKFLNEDFQAYLDTRVEEDDDKDVVRFDAGGDFNRREDADTDFTYYVSWAEIEEIVNLFASYVKTGEGSGGTQAGGAAAVGTANGEIRTFEMDSAGSIVGSFETGKVDKNRNHPLQLRTLDPLICVVDVSGVDDRFRKFSEIGPRSEDHITGSLDPKREGLLYNLYVEWQIIKDAFDNTRTIFKALQYILNKCSGACFQIWNFKSIVDVGAVRYIDANMTDNTVSAILDEDQQGTEHVFRPNTRDSILRDFSFDTNMSDQVKSQIAVQKHTNLDGKKKNAAINSRNDATGQYFQKSFNGSDIVTDNNLKKLNEAKKEAQNRDADVPQPPTLNTVKEESTWAGWFGRFDYEDQRKDATEAFAGFPGESTIKLVYKNYGVAGRAKAFARVMQADTAENSPVNGNITLNMDAQFTLDGIGGLCAFQALKIENIPRVFGNNGVFMIDSVTHSVSTDDWTTEVKTSYLVQNQLTNEDGN